MNLRTTSAEMSLSSGRSLWNTRRECFNGRLYNYRTFLRRGKATSLRSLGTEIGRYGGRGPQNANGRVRFVLGQTSESATLDQIRCRIWLLTRTRHKRRHDTSKDHSSCQTSTGYSRFEFGSCAENIAGVRAALYDWEHTTAPTTKHDAASSLAKSPTSGKVEKPTSLIRRVGATGRSKAFIS